ncbi:MAG: metalloregulator ArsR/SmtB family transcription factor [Coriobacteriia bacterium]|nr:metalloregulator ArsR/SmtB family transcription factor [Coriobacteriia bacterium]
MATSMQYASTQQARHADLKVHATEVAELLKILANPNRLLILCGLIHNPLTVTEIAERVPNISQSALSQNLTKMRSAGILRSEKTGLNVSYAIADERIASVLEVLEKNYCHLENDR